MCADFAYALRKDAGGKWHALLLEDVSAAKVTSLEPNGKPECAMHAMARLQTSMEQRHRAKKWSK